ncbi:MAG: apolipoprotein N-acyltransferase [Methyloprofundus sp.]|nr:apolipoprotein N-acyltransferase [Methyloprofundus sp.]
MYSEALMKKLFNTQWGEVIALFSGLLFTLSFAPFDLSLLIFIALVVFRLLLFNISPKRALLRGFLFGLGIFGLGVSWVFVSMVVNTNSSYALPALITLLYCSFWAIFPAIFAYLFVKVAQHHPEENHSLLFASVWVLIEYLRGEWVLNGFPWLQVAYSQLDSPYAGYIPIMGSYGAAFVVLLLCGLLAEVFIQRSALTLVFVMLPLLTQVGQELKRIDWADVRGELIKVTLLQGNIAQKDKWADENRDNTLRYYRDETAKHWESDVIIWPETAIPAYYNEVKDVYLAPLEKQAVQHQTDIITSLPYKDAAGQLYNSVIVLGQERGMYQKIHLLPFGEYLPWQPISGYLLDLMQVRLGSFTAGAIDQPLLKVAGHAFVTSICYEDAFGAQSIRDIEQARFLVNVTNDGWFDGSIEPHQHLQIARMRALESARYLLRTTNTGITAVVSDKGKVVQQAPLQQAYALTTDIPPISGLTPYARIGDKPIMLFILLLFLGLVGKARYFS